MLLYSKKQPGPLLYPALRWAVGTIELAEERLNRRRTVASGVIVPAPSGEDTTRRRG